MQKSIIVHLNGDEKHIEPNLSISSVLEQWDLEQAKFALAINSLFVPKSQYAHYQLKHGDCIDLLRPVAGG